MEKTVAALYQLYPKVPEDTGKALAGLAWFYTRGEAADGGGAEAHGDKGAAKQGAARGKADKRAFSFERDANLIYAAFYATYHISLTTVEFLHWWEFMALFEGLPEDTLIRRVMYWRTAELSALSKEERKQVLKMRALFPLEEAAREPVDVGAMNRRTQERVAQRFAQAERLKTVPDER